MSMRLMGFWRKRVPHVTVVAPPGMPRAAEEARALLLEYATALGVRLPPLLVELEEGKKETGMMLPERLEVAGEMPCYRLRAPLRGGQVDEGRLREALLRALEDAGLLRRRTLGDEEGTGATTSVATAPLQTGETAAKGEKGGALRETTAAERDGGRRLRRRSLWPEPRRRANVALPEAVAASELPALRDALARRGLELLRAKPYPAPDLRARKLDSVGEIALRQPFLAAVILRQLAAGALDGLEYVKVKTPPRATDRELQQVAHELTGAEVVAGVKVGHRLLYLRLPLGSAELSSYLAGEWLERMVARAVTRAMRGVGRTSLVATQVAVRLGDGSEAELDVVAVWREELVWVECASRPRGLLGRAGRRRFTLAERLLAEDRQLVVVMEGTDEELEQVREAYGCPVWQPEQGLDVLVELLELKSQGEGQTRSSHADKEYLAWLRWSAERRNAERGERDGAERADE